MVRPVPQQIGTGYGVPGAWAAGYHTGVDFECPAGTTVHATYPGRVVGVGNVDGSSYGFHQVVIESTYQGRVIRHLYAHMSRYIVTVGARVNAGQPIGISGYEGNVRPAGPAGAHLHYEERVAPFAYANHVRPVLYDVPAPKETPMLRGIDISAYQDEIPQLDFVPDWVGIKVTEVYKNSAGQIVWYFNPKAQRQMEWARSIGAVVCWYMFHHASAEVGVSAESQVDFFLTKIPTLAETDWLAEDWEAFKGHWPTNDEKDRAIKRMQAKRPHNLAGLYCNLYFWKTIDKTSFVGDFFWPADPNNPAGHPNVVHPWQVQQTGYLQDRNGRNIDADSLNFASKAALIAFSRSKAAVLVPKPPPLTPAQQAAANQQVALIKHYANTLGSAYADSTPRGHAARVTANTWKGIA